MKKLLKSVFFLTWLVFGGSAWADEVSSSDMLKEFNFRIEPIAAMYGSPGLDIDIGVAPSWSVGPTGQFFENSLSNTSSEYFEMGGQAAYYFSHERFENSWFIRQELALDRSDRLSGHTGNSSTLNSFVSSSIAGYDFRLSRSGLNSTVGTGFCFYTNHNDTGVQPILEWSVGWAI